MLFKNARPYSFAPTQEVSAANLEPFAFRPCHSFDLRTMGFAPVVGSDFAPTLNGFTLLCVKRQEKIISPSMVNERVSTRVAELGRAPAKKERRALRDDVIASLLPTAHTRTTLTFAYWDAKNSVVVVDHSSRAVADEVMGLLSRALHSPVPMPQELPSLGGQLTVWLLYQRVPDRLEVLSEAVLAATEGRGEVRVAHADLFSDEVAAHIASGMEVSRLRLTLEDKVAFTLGDDFVLRNIKFSAAEAAPEGGVEQAMSDFALTSGVLTEVFQYIAEPRS